MTMLLRRLAVYLGTFSTADCAVAGTGWVVDDAVPTASPAKNPIIPIMTQPAVLTVPSSTAMQGAGTAPLQPAACNASCCGAAAHSAYWQCSARCSPLQVLLYLVLWQVLLAKEPVCNEPAKRCSRQAPDQSARHMYMCVCLHLLSHA